ncbi:hypothetical protein C627_07295 [Corynebacterium glutamicum ZL-6]|uniref:Uncharacterized protein n=2 Tax=Corynebacterium glutamicum TaxID=1718 RepID=Q8NQT3_CORGL|nr:hypothetical protein C624_07520 [Corynebacterium glutamicum SCgG1]AGN22104.1 hypothetical protein C629_07520 [Corynebacterium glutamicum SCgG2]ANR62424.1 hypothetical protein C628_07365 [[Brevibacterium] flavum ZL-1]ANR65426.1 hypothetical protein C627_07295 [Corynebacterium glutamicum ZL-6]ARV64515.1 hypothetical protein B7P23_06215 [Corynebacterium glutamicum]EOA63810.1 hypothetical protein J433_12372 [Corynebacterium glutamicum MT]EPP40817.1 hypothetical protein A583_07028 [Corynebacter
MGTYQLALSIQHIKPRTGLNQRRALNVLLLVPRSIRCPDALRWCTRYNTVRRHSWCKYLAPAVF